MVDVGGRWWKKVYVGNVEEFVGILRYLGGVLVVDIVRRYNLTSGLEYSLNMFKLGTPFQPTVLLNI